MLFCKNFGIKKTTVYRIDFDGDFLVFHFHQSESLFAISVFRYAGNGHFVVKRFRVAKAKLIDAVYFSSAVNVFVSDKNRGGFVPGDYIPKCVPFAGLYVQAFLDFGTYRISRFVKENESVG